MDCQVQYVEVEWCLSLSHIMQYTLQLNIIWTVKSHMSNWQTPCWFWKVIWWFYQLRIHKHVSTLTHLWQIQSGDSECWWRLTLLGSVYCWWHGGDFMAWNYFQYCLDCQVPYCLLHHHILHNHVSYVCCCSYPMLICTSHTTCKPILIWTAKSHIFFFTAI